MNTKQTILITGSTDGLGRGIAFDLAAKGYSLILHGRNNTKGLALLQDIEKETGNKALFYYNADFASLAEIKQLAAAILTNHAQLHVLINNAGLGVEPNRRTSRDGYEMIFQVDYLSTYLLSKLLLPLLQASKPARIVHVASAGQAPIDFSNPLLERHWDGVQAYCQAKLAQIMLGIEWGNEQKANGVMINSLHPASYMPTKIVTNFYKPQSTLQEGIDAVVNLAVNPRLADVSGKYFNRLQETRALAQAYDPQARQQLIELSEKLTGI